MMHIIFAGVLAVALLGLWLLWDKHEAKVTDATEKLLDASQYQTYHDFRERKGEPEYERRPVKDDKG